MANWTNLAALVRDESAQDLIEYALLATFIALVAIAGASSLGLMFNHWYNAVTANVNSDAASAAS